jgi:membrane protein
MIARKLKFTWKIIKATWPYFSEHRLTKLSAALSYYTIFSLPPMLVIIIGVCSIFFGHDAVQGKIFGMIKEYVGSDPALQIQNALSKITLEHNNIITTIIGAVTLLIGATGIFGEIQDSINYTWGIKAKPKKGFLKLVLNRLLSFSMVLVLGFIFMVSLLLNALVDLLLDKLKMRFHEIFVMGTYVINYLLIYLITTILFACIFKVLPDAKVKWRYVLPGALATAFLFLIGKYLISLYLLNNSIISAYGAAGSVIILLIWVYYSSIILYFGAELTQVYVKIKGIIIEPTNYSVFIENITKEKNSNL